MRSGTPRNGRDNRHHISIGEPGVEYTLEPDIAIINVDVYESPQLSLAREQRRTQAGMAFIQVS
jgi:hypothetical protein